MYFIQPYTYEQALKLGVKISPSLKNGKKIDIFDWNCNYMFSIGDINYGDFPTYAKQYGMEYALQRRKLYRKRHVKESKILGSKGYYAYFLLW
jgi:hypothetical protein